MQLCIQWFPSSVRVQEARRRGPARVLQRTHRCCVCVSQVLDLYSPRWECLDEGQYTQTLPWLRPRAFYTCFHGNRLYTIKPSMHEKLWELQVRESTLACTHTYTHTHSPACTRAGMVACAYGHLACACSGLYVQARCAVASHPARASARPQRPSAWALCATGYSMP